ncbi:Exodeoxyribonuclease VII large subunit [Mariniphaga anaerophila]|uniref:Exodeoxyribonuclease 7 large subunit n=1 Tax=Mariniphaga anaerophila TaxID=1484053 RepID=A0A1M4W4V3_9BACT|nr:exodeoxyribonuclease VII large subunit [Mariniphaga anaerophila]SHE76227.1 Exodeoxyribonuclease VII large subunit [Mariniphaga anaerophila]
MEQKLTLFELNRQIKDALSSAIPKTVWVVAEISELKENRTGHCYLELVEKDGRETIARARATIWSYTYRILKPYFETTTGQLFTHGIKVLVQVSVEYHPAYGLSLNIKDIDPAYTVGDMALQRKEIIEKLQSEGVFDMNKQLELPLVPQKIAVISSKTAAGYQDFMKQLESNSYGIKFYTQIFEAFMQGNETVPSVISALDRIFEYEDFFDAVAIIRGGGATADLSSFDNFDLAYYVTQFPLAVVTGIGHEKDDTVIDLVAHTRLKTPTAVAEFFISGAGQFYEHLTELETEVVQLAREAVETKQEQLGKFAANLHRNVDEFIDEKSKQLLKTGNSLQQQVNRFAFNKKYELNNLKHNLNSALSVWKVEQKSSIDRQKRILRRVVIESLLKEEANFGRLKEQVKHRFVSFLAKEKEWISRSENTVRLLNPENVLKRGYTLTLKGGKIVKSANSLHLNDEIEIRFANGSVKSKITNKE